MANLEGVFTVCLAMLIVVVGLGLGADSTYDDFKQALQRPRAVCIGFSSQYGFMPLLSFAMARASKTSEFTQIGMILLGCAPGGTSSNLFTLWSKGDVPLSITMSFLSTLAAFFMLPLCVFVYIYSLSDVNVTMPWTQIMVSCLLIALPTAIGVAVRRYNTTFQVGGKFIWQWMHDATTVIGAMFIGGALIFGFLMYWDKVTAAPWQFGPSRSAWSPLAPSLGTTAQRPSGCRAGSSAPSPSSAACRTRPSPSP